MLLINLLLKNSLNNRSFWQSSGIGVLMTSKTFSFNKDFGKKTIANSCLRPVTLDTPFLRCLTTSTKSKKKRIVGFERKDARSRAHIKTHLKLISSVVLSHTLNITTAHLVFILKNILNGF